MPCSLRPRRRTGIGGALTEEAQVAETVLSGAPRSLAQRQLVDDDVAGGARFFVARFVQVADGLSVPGDGAGDAGACGARIRPDDATAQLLVIAVIAFDGLAMYVPARSTTSPSSTVSG